jgi:hypothetical protein
MLSPLLHVLDNPNGQGKIIRGFLFCVSGQNFEKVMTDMYDTIRDVYLKKEKHFIEAVKQFKSKE